MAALDLVPKVVWGEQGWNYSSTWAGECDEVVSARADLSVPRLVANYHLRIPCDWVPFIQTFYLSSSFLTSQKWLAIPLCRGPWDEDTTSVV